MCTACAHDHQLIQSHVSLALLRQLMRADVLKFLASIGMSEADIVRWANQRVGYSGSSLHIKRCGDFLRLLAICYYHSHLLNITTSKGAATRRCAPASSCCSCWGRWHPSALSPPRCYQAPRSESARSTRGTRSAAHTRWAAASSSRTRTSCRSSPSCNRCHASLQPYASMPSAMANQASIPCTHHARTCMHAPSPHRAGQA